MDTTDTPAVERRCNAGGKRLRTPQVRSIVRFVAQAPTDEAVPRRSEAVAARMSKSAMHLAKPRYRPDPTSSTVRQAR